MKIRLWFGGRKQWSTKSLIKGQKSWWHCLVEVPCCDQCGQYDLWTVTNCNNIFFLSVRNVVSGHNCTVVTLQWSPWSV